jgi:preprotein translocase subunit SecF
LDFVGKRGWFFLVSGLLILPGLISLVIPPTLTPGIDFTSGSALEVTFVQGTDVNEEDVRNVLDDHGHSEALIQKTGARSVFIRTDVLQAEVEGPGGAVSSEQAVIERDLEDRIGRIESRDLDTVSAIVAEEMVRNAVIAVLFAALGILVYVTWAFRNIPNSFRYGVSAILALVHDMILIIGIFSILGKALNVEVNSMFIVGLLTVLGYSVNDTIVVFDRIRENVARNPDRPFPGVVNLSILETIGRSLNTSLTTLFVLLALLLFGGSTIRPFLLVLIIGVVIGTYSSAAIASQFLVIWERGELRRALGFLPFVRRAPAGSG